MNKLAFIAGLAALKVFQGSPLLAATADKAQGNSLFTTFFFAVCSLIVVVLMVPALKFFRPFVAAWLDVVERKMLMVSRTPWMAGVHHGGAVDEDQTTSLVVEIEFENNCN